MKLIKKHLLVLLVGMLLIIMTGCGVAKNEITNIESGTMNADYRGDSDPIVPMEIMLSDEEKANGIEKIKIKCGVEIDAPVQPQNSINEKEDSGGDSGGKPHI